MIIDIHLDNRIVCKEHCLSSVLCSEWRMHAGSVQSTDRRVHKKLGMRCHNVQYIKKHGKQRTFPNSVCTVQDNPHSTASDLYSGCARFESRPALSTLGSSCLS